MEIVISEREDPDRDVFPAREEAMEERAGGTGFVDADCLE
jgi:hypothetical protein